MEENKKLEDLSELMQKINESMKITRDKKTQLEQKEVNLYSETSPMMVEKGKEDIENLKKEKSEFDEMTQNAMVKAKKDILALKKESEKAYQEALMEGMKKQKEMEEKLNSLMGNDLSEDKMKMVKEGYEKAKDKLEASMEEMKEQHFKQEEMLEGYEEDINLYALELGISDVLDKVELENSEQENNEHETGKTAENKDQSDETVGKAEEEAEKAEEEAEKGENKAENGDESKENTATAEAKTDESKAEETKKEESKVTGAKADESKVTGAKTGESKETGAKADVSKVTWPWEKADGSKETGAKADESKVTGAKAEESKVAGAKTDDSKVIWRWPKTDDSKVTGAKADVSKEIDPTGKDNKVEEEEFRDEENNKEAEPETFERLEINAKEGKLKIIYGDEKLNKEESLQEILSTKKNLYKRIRMNSMKRYYGLEKHLGIMAKLMLMRRINPAIIKAIDAYGESFEDDKYEQYAQYFDALILNGYEMPFDVDYDLRNSTMASKDFRVMNRYAKNDQDIEGVVAIGVRKNLFERMRNSIRRKLLKGSKRREQLTEGREGEEFASYEEKRESFLREKEASKEVKEKSEKIMEDFGKDNSTTYFVRGVPENEEKSDDDKTVKEENKGEHDDDFNI